MLSIYYHVFRSAYFVDINKTDLAADKPREYLRSASPGCQICSLPDGQKLEEKTIRCPVPPPWSSGNTSRRSSSKCGQKSQEKATFPSSPARCSGASSWRCTPFWFCWHRCCEGTTRNGRSGLPPPRLS